MKNDVTDKSIMRRYLDDMYTREEARGLLSRLKDDIHAPNTGRIGNRCLERSRYGRAHHRHGT